MRESVVRRLPKTFRSGPPREAPKRFGWVKGLIVAAVVAGGGWFVLASKTFAVTSVELTGTDAAAAHSFSQALVGKNIFLLNVTAIESGLIESYPPIASVKLVRGLPHTVRLAVTLRQPKLRWESNQVVSILDANGIAFDQLPTITYPELPTVRDSSGLPVAIGQSVASKLFIEFINQAHAVLPQQFPNEPIRFEIGETTTLIDVRIGSRVVKLTLLRPLEAQLRDVATLTQRHPDAMHIDVRVAGWGYWK